MRVGEERVISFGCVGCLKAFIYFPHPYCYEDVCYNMVIWLLENNYIK